MIEKSTTLPEMESRAFFDICRENWIVQDGASEICSERNHLCAAYLLVICSSI